MSISQKCQYAIRALLDLAEHWSAQAPVRSSEIAARQAIPQRFLENILNELKTAGLVDARRGPQGGFLLACEPEHLKVGRVIRLVDGSFDPVQCTKGKDHRHCPLMGRCALLPLWEEAKAAVESVYDRVTFAELASRGTALVLEQTPDYCI
jgi:Rrf2 family transcriptional regulator, cysteine metabolism repressor